MSRRLSCVNCGGGPLRLSASGETKKCGNCGCANLAVKREHYVAAIKAESLLTARMRNTNKLKD